MGRDEIFNLGIRLYCVFQHQGPARGGYYRICPREKGIKSKNLKEIVVLYLKIFSSLLVQSKKLYLGPYHIIFILDFQVEFLIDYYPQYSDNLSPR